MKKQFSLILCVLAIIILPGCIKLKSGSSNATLQSYGGVYKSLNKGESWAQSSTVASVSAEKQSISNLNITSITLDPQDHNAIYIGTETNGLFLSYDGGDIWQQFKASSKGKVEDIAVHSQNKCILYMSTLNTLMKSYNCGRDWERVYFDARTDLRIKSIAIDWYMPDIIYIGTSSGDILQSVDSGKTWRNLYQTGSTIIDIIIGADTRNVYVATQNYGLFVSKDKGQTWTKRYDELNKVISSSELTSMTIDYKNNVIVVATNNALAKSKDLGATWESIPLLTPNNTVTIRVVAVNPDNHNIIYYTTGSAFFKSVDGGKKWSSSQLPTASIPTSLFVYPSDNNKLYMTFKKTGQE